MALNHATHRLYVAGLAASGFQNLAVKVIDTTTGARVADIDLGREVVGNVTNRFSPYSIAADESTGADGNRVYLLGQKGLQYYIRTLQNDAVVANADVPVQGQPYGYQAFAVNSVTHKVYFVNQYGVVTVVHGPTHAILGTFDSGAGLGPHVLIANPAANKLLLFARNGNGAVIDGASDTATPFTVPSAFNASSGVYDPADGRTYVFGAENTSNGVSRLYVFDSSGGIVASRTAGLNPADFRGMTIDPATNTLYLATPIIGTDPGRILALNAADLSDRPGFAHGAGAVSFDSGRLFILDYNFGETFAELRNAVGILNVANGTLSKVVLGYRPYKAAVNTQTNRVYVIDEQAAELVVINGADHSILARVPVIGANTGSYNAKFLLARLVAVSSALNRIYLPRVEQSADDGTKIAYLDVIDGANNQLVTSIPISTGYLVGSLLLAVDDTRHRVYLTSVDPGTNEPRLYVINAENNTVSTSIPIMNSLIGLAVNPVTGKIYISGRPSGGMVQILDASFNSLGMVGAGAVPGPMAVNTQTNKIYVANTGAGSVDNSVTVIDGATDQTETTFSNTHANNGDAVSDVAVDPATNKVYVADNSNGYDANGRITVFNGANNSFQQQIDVGRYPMGLAFNPVTSELFVPNNEDGNLSVIGSGVPPAPPAPPHGGLSATVFRVNGSQNASANLADTPLHFSAQQSGTPNALKVRVQINTVANNDANDWVDLPNGSGGYMTLDKTTGQFVLTSTNYPLANGLYFRALSTASGYPESKSNIVGPFNLAPSKNHLGATVLTLATNGPAAEIKFRSSIAVDQAGTTLYLQSTLTPDDDASWTGLDDGRAGQMFSYADRLHFYLDSDKYPAGAQVYFRAVAKAVGFVDSYSNIVGVKNLVQGNRPDVELTPLTTPASGNDGTSAATPLVYNFGTIRFNARLDPTITFTRQIKKISLYYDGAQIAVAENGATSVTSDYTTSVPGDHVIKAVAIDELGIRGFAPPVYIRVKPPGGRIFTMQNSGDWSNPANWLNELGQNGVPGALDLAIIAGKSANVNTSVTAFATSLIGGTLNGTGGAFNVSGILSVASGALKNINLAINPGGAMVLTSDDDVPMSGTVNNAGKIRVTGRGGIVPVKTTAAKPGADQSADPNGFFDGVAAFFKNVGEFIFHRPNLKPAPAPAGTPPPRPLPHGVAATKFENSGKLIGPNGGSLLSEGGLGLIAPNGGTLISQDGASLISQDGGSIISNDGASLIGQDGASLITNDGGSIAPFGNEAPAGAAGFVQTGGETDLSGLQIVSSVSLDGGTLSGTGVIVGSLTNHGGYISPGHSAGTIAVTGDFAQGANGTLIVENGGRDLGQSDLLQVNGAATLGGNLHVKTINGYAPDAADTFSPLSFASASGAFATNGGNVQLAANANGLLASIIPGAPQPPIGQPANISTRMKVLTGDKVLIGGFIVQGPAGSTKAVLDPRQRPEPGGGGISRRLERSGAPALQAGRLQPNERQLANRAEPGPHPGWLRADRSARIAPHRRFGAGKLHRDRARRRWRERDRVDRDLRHRREP